MSENVSPWLYKGFSSERRHGKDVVDCELPSNECHVMCGDKCATARSWGAPLRCIGSLLFTIVVVWMIVAMFKRASNRSGDDGYF